MRRLDKVGNWKGVDRPKTHSYKMFSPFHCFFFTPNFYPIPTLEFCIQRITFLIFRGTFPTVRRPRQSRIAAHRPAPGRLLHGARPAPRSPAPAQPPGGAAAPRSSRVRTPTPSPRPLAPACRGENRTGRSRSNRRRY